MKKYIAVICISCLYMSCGGGLSDEQRKALKNELEEREIRKIPEEDIVEATFKKGRKLLAQYQAGADTLLNKLEVDARILKKNDSTTSKVEWELLEAYKYSMTQGAQPAENVQRDGEVMVYTMPLIENNMFEGIYVIRIPRKTIVQDL